MSRFRGMKIAAAVLFVFGLAVFLTWSFLQGRKEAAREEEGDQPVKAVSRVTLLKGLTIIRLDAADQKLNGIVVKALARGFFGTGQKRTAGALVPDSAVVWLDGRAWAYVREGADRFVRHEVPLRHRTGMGWLVTKNFSPGDSVVTGGAQLLLSEEFRSKIRISD